MEVRYKRLPGGKVVCQESRKAVLQKNRQVQKKALVTVIPKLCLKVTLIIRTYHNSSWSDLVLQRVYASGQIADIRPLIIQ